MARFEWGKRNRLERPRQPDWESRLERQTTEYLGRLGTLSPSSQSRNASGYLSARGKNAPRDDKCDIWRVIGAYCPWNPTPGIRVVQHITSLAEARRLGLR